MGRATVEKVAVNAVMAGCKPDYFPVVLAGVEGLCDTAFCAHGLSITLMSGAPLAIINGPVRNQIALNSGHNVLGHGFRANATIGRALRLVTLNIGGAKPHGVTKATLGHPGQYSFLVAENEEVSPWEPLHVERGFKKEDSAITLFGGTGFFQVADFASNTAERLVSTIGGTMGGGINNYREYPLMSDTVLVLSPRACQDHRGRWMVQARRPQLSIRDGRAAAARTGYSGTAARASGQMDHRGRWRAQVPLARHDHRGRRWRNRRTPFSRHSRVGVGGVGRQRAGQQVDSPGVKWVVN
jgi:hypothetical protein